MNLYQCQTGIKNYVINNANYDLSNYSRFISNSIHFLKNQSYEIELKPIKNEEKNLFKYEIIQKENRKYENRKYENGIKELFSELTKEIYISKLFYKDFEIKIIDKNEEENYIELDKELTLEEDEDTKHKFTKIYLKPNIYQLIKQKEAIDNLKNKPLKHHIPLLNLFGFPNNTCWNQNYNNYEEFDWKILTDYNRDGTEEQREFVKKALQTKDFALLEGPPGSGKTTTIIELIIQLVQQGKRVLLCSATHVAIDNVLERILENYKSKTEGIIMPIRISNNEKSVQENVRPYILKNYVKKNKEIIKNKLKNNSFKSAAYLLNNIEKEDKNIEKLFLNAANLVAGTTIGILKHPDIENNNLENLFDVLIIDEASKVTFQEFLIPAMHAKKWILVGDIKQLSPYIEDDYVTSYISENLKINLETAEEIANKLNQQYSFRNTSGFESIDNNLKRLIPNNEKSISEIDNLKRIAFPSILELLQNGIGKSKSQTGNRLISNGFDEIHKESRFTSIKYQHRMHDDIARTSRENFYDGENLVTSETTKNDNSWEYINEVRVSWVNSGFNSSKNKIINESEIENIKKEIENFRDWNIKNKKTKVYEIAVLTFYVDQCNELRKMLQKLTNQRNSSNFKINNIKIKLCTVDRFQGQEADMVLLGFTKFSTTAFYNSPNRLNVALTRARHKLILFGDSKKLEKEAKLKALRDLAQFNRKISR